MSQRQAHYVLSTHWDREWYQSFQNFRYQLVRMLDKVLEGWAKGTLKGPFQSDGQAIVLEDYLEVRPEQARRDRGAPPIRQAGRWAVVRDAG